LCCILTLWLERTGDAIFSLIPPNAITSSILLDLDDGVDGKKGTMAIRGAPLPSDALFSHLAGVFSEVFELTHPSSLLLGERSAAPFAAKRGEAGIFYPRRNIPEHSVEARKEFLVGVACTAPSAMDPSMSESMAASKAAGGIGVMVITAATAAKGVAENEVADVVRGVAAG
jgi:hypothetical protein